MIGLPGFEVCKSIFNITEESNKFEIYTFPDWKTGGITCEKVKDEVEKHLDVSYITATDLQNEIKGPNIFEDKRKEVSKRMKSDKHMNNLANYTSFVYQGFESYLGTEVDLVENDIRLVLVGFNSSVITYEIPPGIYTFKDLSEFLAFNF